METAFSKLKALLTSASIHPDPSRPFVVKVDALDVGGLSQRNVSDQKLHPCVIFSRLSPTETNYDMGNRELLVVVLVLQEWRHWLEGSELPFVVWTDNNTLAYLCSTKRLNCRQVQWALFLGRFDFTLTYRPGSRNVKLDALSRQFSVDPDVPEAGQLPQGPGSSVPCGSEGVAFL